MSELREDLLTIFTPVYNRARLLGRLFDSLKCQTCSKFEWIALDDGSTDNTLDTLHKLADGCSSFPITIIHTENGGKHRAINRAVKEAHGEYFLILDSDDYLTPHAVADVFTWIEAVKRAHDYDNFAGVSGLRVFHDGSTIGGAGPGGEYVDALASERKKYNLGGDKAEVYKTSIMRQFPFVEFEGENFLTEGSVWLLISAAGLKLRWYPVPVIVGEYLPDGLSACLLENSIKSFNGFVYSTNIGRKLGEDTSLLGQIKHIAYYAHVAKEKGLSFQEAASRLPVKPSVLFCCYSIRWLFKAISNFVVRITKRRKL